MTWRRGGGNTPSIIFISTPPPSLVRLFVGLMVYMPPCHVYLLHCPIAISLLDLVKLTIWTHFIPTDRLKYATFVERLTKEANEWQSYNH